MKNFLNTNKHLFDFSNFLKDSKFFDMANKRVIGKMKDVSEGKIVDEFVGLKSKMYSMENIDGKESNTAKGVNIATEFNEFKDILFNKKIMRHKMRRIRAEKHKVRTYKIDKISLSVFDDKRFVFNDGIHTLAYFHKDIDSYKKKRINKKRVPIEKKEIHTKEEILTDKKDFHKKKRFSRIERIQKDSHKNEKFSQMITSKNKCLQINS